jgi:hypothetical protein
MGAEGMRASLVRDDDHPFVMRGIAYMTKDGAPIEFFAPAEGFLGEYTWYNEHFESVITLGQLFPKWGAPQGSKGSILHASSLRNAIATPAAIRGAILAILTLPPLLLSSESSAEININGHSGHVSPPEWARAIGERPHFTFPLSAGLEDGFTDRQGGDSDALGHWLRDADARESSSTAYADSSEANTKPPAAPTARGRSGSHGRMRVYYGMSGATSNRVGERFKQLDVRQRLTRTIADILRAKCPDWTRLPGGQRDLDLLRSVRGRAPTLFRPASHGAA